MSSTADDIAFEMAEEAWLFGSLGDSINTVAVQMGVSIDVARGQLAAAQTMRLAQLNTQSGQQFSTLYQAVQQGYGTQGDKLFAQTSGLATGDLLLNQTTNVAKHDFSQNAIYKTPQGAGDVYKTPSDGGEKKKP